MAHYERNALKNIDNLIELIAPLDKIFIFSDFDGTLARFRKNPGDVKLSIKTLHILESISENLKIITGIVSGRKISELEFFLGNLLSERFNLFGCHGSEIKFKGSNIKTADEALRSMEYIEIIQDEIEKKFKNIRSFIFEKKEKSFAVNYRNAKYSEKEQIEGIKNTFQEFEKKYPVKLLELKKVFEIVPDTINKSFAIKATKKKYCKTLKESSHIFLCIGDDITDENLFMENINGINIKVGSYNPHKTNAQYFLNNISEVIFFLKKITCINS